MYKKKTLLELSKTVRFHKDTRGDKVLSINMSKFGDELTAESGQSTSSTIRHRSQPSMDLIRQLPSKNTGYEVERDGESTSLHSHSSSRRRRKSSGTLLNSGPLRHLGTHNASDELLADKIYQALKKELDDEDEEIVDTERAGTMILRELKQSLTIKRLVKARLVSYSADKPTKIGCYRRLIYSIGMMWSHFIFSLKEMSQRVELWHHHIHTIEGHFGSGVATYFYFFRHLFYLNLFFALLIISFVFIPQEIYHYVQIGVDNNNLSRTAFTGKEFLTGTGWFTNTELYYGAYTNNTVELSSKFVYHLPEAYLFTNLAYFVLTIIILAYGVASSYKKNFVVTSESISRSLPIKVFCGWDFQIASEDAALLKQKSLYNEISVMLSVLKKVKVSKDLCLVIGHYLMRLGINIVVIVMIGGTGTVVYFLLDSKALKAEIPVLGEMVLAVVITLIMIFFPLMCNTMAEWEEYKSRQTQLYVTLVRTFVMQSVILGMLMYFWLHFASHDWQERCWETKLGQEIYRLVVVLFLMMLLQTFCADFVRKIISKAFPSVGEAEFDTATNTLNIIYMQTLCWLGTYFSPLMPVIMIVAMFFLFYVKRYSTQWNCRPSAKPWKASLAQTVFLSLTFLSLILTVIAVGYTTLKAHPSAVCGPFCHKKTSYAVMIHVLDTIVNVKVLGLIFKYATAPASVACILLLLSIMIYYLRAMMKAYEEMTNLLREQLILESKDKVFLLRWFESAMQGIPSVPLEKPSDTSNNNNLVQPSTSKIIGKLADASIGALGSKLKTVMNPLYRDKSRKDRENVTDPDEMPAIKIESTYASPETKETTSSPKPSTSIPFFNDLIPKKYIPDFTIEQNKLREAFQRKK